MQPVPLAPSCKTVLRAYDCPDRGGFGPRAVLSCCAGPAIQRHPPCRNLSRPHCSGSGWGPGLPTRSSPGRQRERPVLRGECGATPLGAPWCAWGWSQAPPCQLLRTSLLRVMPPARLPLASSLCPPRAPGGPALCLLTHHPFPPHIPGPQAGWWEQRDPGSVLHCALVGGCPLAPCLPPPQGGPASASLGRT